MNWCVLNCRAPSGHCVQVISDSSLRGSFPPQTAEQIGSLGRNVDGFLENTISDVLFSSFVFECDFFLADRKGLGDNWLIQTKKYACELNYIYALNKSYVQV